MKRKQLKTKLTHATVSKMHRNDVEEALAKFKLGTYLFNKPEGIFPIAMLISLGLVLALHSKEYLKQMTSSPTLFIVLCCLPIVAIILLIGIVYNYYSLKKSPGYKWNYDLLNQRLVEIGKQEEHQLAQTKRAVEESMEAIRDIRQKYGAGPRFWDLFRQVPWE